MTPTKEFAKFRALLQQMAPESPTDTRARMYSARFPAVAPFIPTEHRLFDSPFTHSVINLSFPGRKKKKKKSKVSDQIQLGATKTTLSRGPEEFRLQTLLKSNTNVHGNLKMEARAPWRSVL